MKNHRWVVHLLVVAVAVALTIGAPSAKAAAPAGLSLDDFLQQIQSKDANTRRAAWEKCAPLGAPAIAPLAKLVAKWDPEKVPAGKPDAATQQALDVAKAAGTALDFIAYHAGRPGADAERKAVGAELAKLIAAGPAEPVRVKALFLLQTVGTGAEVPALAKLLDESDAKMRERARAALERIPGKAADDAFLAALSKASGEFQRALIATLGQRRSQAAVEPLMNLARSDDADTCLAAVEALARLGDGRAAPALSAAILNLNGMQRKAALNSYLQLADTLLSAGNGKDAAAIYVDVLKGKESDSIRTAALLGYGQTGAPGALAVMLQAMTDPSPRIRNAAAAVLAAMPGEDVNARLAGMSARAQSATKAALLRALAARKAPQAPALLKEAARDPNAEVRVMALELLGGSGDPSLEPTLLEAAEKGSPDVKAVALRSYLKLAAARAQAGDKAEAAEMYGRALNLAGDTREIQRAAFDGLAGLARPESLTKIEQLMAEGSAVRNEAARAYVAVVVALGKAGQKDDAIKRLTTLSEQRYAPGVTRDAISGLAALGADTSAYSARLGFLPQWWLLGPVAWSKETLKNSDFDVNNVAPGQSVKLGDKTLKWKEFKSTNPQGVVDLAPQFKPNQNVAAYAYAELNCPDNRQVNLRIGSDDGFVLWVNGKQLEAKDVTRPWAADEDTVANVPLVKGTNKILLKITQGGGEWVFSLRVANQQNRPLDLTRLGER